LPTDAPLSTLAAWNRLFARLAPEAGLMPPITLRRYARRSRCWQKAPKLPAKSARPSSRAALAIWRKALLAGPAASVDATLETMKQDDGLEACACVAWMPASALAASPRRFVRLLGLNSSRWPRGIAEDRLIPDHIIPTPILDPLPVNLADRRDFETIFATTGDAVVLSRARRDSDGRLLGRSPSSPGTATKPICAATRPAHAFSESDRLMARPRSSPPIHRRRARSAAGATGGRRKLPPMTGWCADHPLMLAILGRPSRPAHCAACYATRSVSCGSTGSGGASRRAAPNPSCSMR
jgi:hypothetical protein